MINISPKERNLLSAMRKRAPMFVGEYSLAKLSIFLGAYGIALKEYELDSRYCMIPAGFNEFVRDLVKEQAPLSESIIKQIH